MIFEKFACPHCGRMLQVTFDGYMEAGSHLTIECETCKKKIVGTVGFSLCNAYIDVDQYQTDGSTKYNWHHAPSWAQWAWMQPSGACYWTQEHPTLNFSNIWVHDADMRMEDIAPQDVFFRGLSLDSLEARPITFLIYV